MRTHFGVVGVVGRVGVLAGGIAASFLAFAPPAAANGILVTSAGEIVRVDTSPMPPTGRPAARRGPVWLRSHRVTARITGPAAEVTVEQVFHSDAEGPLEGTYLFPLPEGAAVGKFAMTMGGKMVEGQVIEANEARRVYESIVSRRRDPGLLEYVGRGLYRARVFPILPRSDLTVRLEFQQVLPDDDGTLEFRYPLATERLNGQPVEEALVDVRIEGDADLKAVYSPSHTVDVVRDGERKARVVYERAGRVQDRDFLLYVGRSPEAVGFSVLSHRAAGEDGTFLAVISPKSDVPDSEIAPRDVVYVLDTSGSMAGEKMEQARRALAFGVTLLRPVDRFNVVAFSTSVQPFRDGLVAAEVETKKAAQAFIEGLRATGGTNIEGALAAALAPSGSGSADRPLYVVFLTDGKPTVGVADPKELLAAVERRNTSRARIFTFGVGYDLDVDLLDRIAETTGALRDYVEPGQDLEVVTGRFFKKIHSPVLSDVTLDLGPGVYDVYPPKIPDVFAGSQVVVFGKYRESGDRTIRVTGRLGGKAWTREQPATFRAGEGAGFLPRLWANRKVAYLLDQIRLHGANQELTDEVIHLATRFGIVTPYTAGLVVEDSELEGAARLRARAGFGDAGGRFARPGSTVPPGLREPSDPTAPAPPEASGGAGGAPPAGAVPTPTPPPVTTPAAAGEGKVRDSKDLAKRKDEGSADADDADGLGSVRDRVKAVEGKTFVLGKDGRWVDTEWKGKPDPVRVEAFSAAYFDLLKKGDLVAKFLAVGEKVVFLLDGAAYEIVPAPPESPK